MSASSQALALDVWGGLRPFALLCPRTWTTSSIFGFPNDQKNSSAKYGAILAEVRCVDMFRRCLRKGCETKTHDLGLGFPNIVYLGYDMLHLNEVKKRKLRVYLVNHTLWAWRKTTTRRLIPPAY